MCATAVVPEATTPFLGPYRVLQQVKNDVECRHLVMGAIKWFHVTRLKMFHGSEEEGYNAALLDADQHVVRRILRWNGDPMKRTTMEFKVGFADDDRHIMVALFQGLG